MQAERSKCAFLYLGAGSEHEFTNDDGDLYTLRVDEIRRVKLGASASRKDVVGRKARASIGAHGVRRVAHREHCRSRDGVHRDAARLKP